MEAVTETQSKLSKKIIAIVVLLGVIISSVIWYFMYFTKTPEYSLNLIKESIQKHDLEGFKKHVDMDSLLSRGYDDLVVVMVDADKTMDEGQKKMVAGFAQMIKGTVVTAFKDGTTRYIETGEWKAKEEAESQGQQKINTDQMADRTGIKNSSFKGIAYTKKEGASATVGIKLFDDSANKEIILDVKMRELNDGTWQIAELSNFKTYLDEIEKGKKESLKKYIEETQPIVDKYNKILREIFEEIKKINSSSAPDEQKKIGIKDLLKNKVLVNDEAKYKELATVKVPMSAKNLNELRLQAKEIRAKRIEKQLQFLGNESSEIARELNQLEQQLIGVDQQVKAILKKSKAE